MNLSSDAQKVYAWGLANKHRLTDSYDFLLIHSAALNIGIDKWGVRAAMEELSLAGLIDIQGDYDGFVPLTPTDIAERRLSHAKAKR